MKRFHATAFLFVLGAAIGRAASGGDTPLPTDDPKAVALFQECAKGRLGFVEGQVEAGAPVDGQVGSYRFTALTESADDGYHDILIYLIAQHASVDLADVEGSTPLLHACSTDHAACALALLDAGANPNLGSKWNRLPLMYAAQHGDNEIVSALLAHHADVNATCDVGSAIWWAAGDHHFDTLKLLLDAGANVTLKQTTPGNARYIPLSLLGLAAYRGDTKAMDLILSHGYDINSGASNGNTAVDAAVIFHQSEALDWLTAHKADLNVPNQKGETALMLAVRYGAAAMMKTLLDAGADPNAQDRLGRTALIYAARNVQEDMAEALVEHGANLNIKDAKGETAYTYAGDVGLTTLVDLLKSKGAATADLHIIVDAVPVTPPSAAQAWALGVGAIYAQSDGVSHTVLSRDRQSPAQAAATLRESWGVRDRAGYFRILKWLVDSGHRARIQAEGARYANMPTLELVVVEFYLAEISLFSPKAGDALRRMQNTRASYLKWGDRSGLAWDLCRAANFIRYGYDAHYLGEQEAWDNLLPIARLTQGKFASWQEMSDNFLDGREIWDNKRDPRFEMCAQLLLNPKDPNSPWTQNPWKTDLTGK